eukprot:gnl/TRDRNA2_/TRDRNA2_166796_c1_seq1.p1 gnl/TRDRNA2_/TRDRNA2_166796_c1~~gnl/TRDRNA2_/TRDRNA2_166796_c1_seq1.p1  ORF type:complete len:279 (-),score=15.91 gnl/TRDRNA2_/TRDRNA2_166796_c1_seq1:146-982(-)
MALGPIVIQVGQLPKFFLTMHQMARARALWLLFLFVADVSAAKEQCQGESEDVVAWVRLADRNGGGQVNPQSGVKSQSGDAGPQHPNISAEDKPGDYHCSKVHGRKISKQVSPANETMNESIHCYDASEALGKMRNSSNTFRKKMLMNLSKVCVRKQRSSVRSSTIDSCRAYCADGQSYDIQYWLNDPTGAPTLKCSCQGQIDCTQCFDQTEVNAVCSAAPETVTCEGTTNQGVQQGFLLSRILWTDPCTAGCVDFCMRDHPGATEVIDAMPGGCEWR